MSEKTPPFSALRALEAASRHRSFTWAAKELNITHSAVSQAIKRLETELGARLFERKGGAMQPSDAALRLAQAYSDAAQSLGQAIREIADAGDEASLVLGMDSDLGRLWFAGKVGRLSEALPDVRVEVSTDDRSPGDLALLILAAPAEADVVLADLPVFPVCTPDMARQKGLTQARAVLDQTLIDGPGRWWTTWAARLAPQAPAPRPHVFDDLGAALEAAAQGGGIALTHALAAEPFVTAGRLTPLPFRVSMDQNLVLRFQGQGAQSEAGERLAMWLKLEVARTLALLKVKDVS